MFCKALNKKCNTCSKSPLTACDDDRTNIRVTLKNVESLADLLHQPIAESIQSLGSIQGNEPDIRFLTPLLDQNVLICR